MVHVNKLKLFSSNIFYAVVLVYFSYLSVFFAKNPSEISLFLTLSNLLLFIGAVIIQLLFIGIFSQYDNRFIRIVYITFLLLIFTFFNLTDSLFKLVGVLNNHISYHLRFRELLAIFFLILPLIAYYSSNKFSQTLRVISTFLISFVIINVFYGLFHNKNSDEFLSLQSKYNSEPQEFKNGVHEESSTRKNILFIIIDEYSPPSEIRRFTNDSSQVYYLNNFLLSKNFVVLNTRTLKTLTINSLNMLFNQQSGMTFRNESSGNAYSELKYSYVVDSLQRKGYIFDNFGFFTIGNHRPFFEWENPYRKGNLETLLNYSMFPFITANLREDSTSNGNYNKRLESESLRFLNNLEPYQGHFIFVHFLMPHGPFYWEDEFNYRKRNLTNYLLYWNFCNHKIINYLNSINNLSSYKIIISGDHGFKFNGRMINAHSTMSAFYNFEQSGIEKISTVQDIGNLLLSQ